MSRQYRVYELKDQTEAERIVGEVGKLAGVNRVAISADLQEMDIDLDGERVVAVMDRVVNICRKVSDECEVRFKFS